MVEVKEYRMFPLTLIIPNYSGQKYWDFCYVVYADFELILSKTEQFIKNTIYLSQIPLLEDNLLFFYKKPNYCPIITVIQTT